MTFVFNVFWFYLGYFCEMQNAHEAKLIQLSDNLATKLIIN